MISDVANVKKRMDRRYFQQEELRIQNVGKREEVVFHSRQLAIFKLGSADIARGREQIGEKKEKSGARPNYYKWKPARNVNIRRYRWHENRRCEWPARVNAVSSALSLWFSRAIGVGNWECCRQSVVHAAEADLFFSGACEDAKFGHCWVLIDDGYLARRLVMLYRLSMEFSSSEWSFFHLMSTHQVDVGEFPVAKLHNVGPSGERRF